MYFKSHWYKDLEAKDGWEDVEFKGYKGKKLDITDHMYDMAEEESGGYWLVLLHKYSEFSITIFALEDTGGVVYDPIMEEALEEHVFVKKITLRIPSNEFMTNTNSYMKMALNAMSELGAFGPEKGRTL